MSDSDLLFDYAAEVLAFDFKDALPADVPDAPAPSAVKRMAERCAGAFQRSGKERLALIGLGSGAVAEALAQLLPPGALFVCEQNLGLARALMAAGRLRWCQPGQDHACAPARLALDASPWALLFLLDRAGLGPGEAMVLPNPELPPEDKAKMRMLELLLTSSRPLPLPSPQAAAIPKLSAAAILSPAEPGLAEFFAQLPPWLFELALVWDADEIPDIPVPQHFPVWQTARRLERDFSAQRNLMLSACRGDFVLYLDADEGFTSEGWAALPRLCAMPEVGGWLFPRATLYPDPAHVLTGFGLWPDLQLRLFRRSQELCFFNPVHERLTGLCGQQAMALDLDIIHLSRLRKTEAELMRKLQGFDLAGSGEVRHALSPEYPSVPRELLEPRPGGPRALLLPSELG
jgi:hypothetical protein